MGKQILIVDDHLIVRQGIEFLLKDLFEDVTCHHAQTLTSMMQVLKSQAMDVLILDAQFPDGVSLQYIPDIKKEFPEIKILVFTSFEESTHALTFINAGADGYISKLSDESILLEALQNIVHQGFYYTPLTQHLLNLQKINPQFANPLSILSDRELEVAELLADGQGILEIGNVLNLKQNTISTFKKRIFQKMNVQNVKELTEIIKTYKLS